MKLNVKTMFITTYSYSLTTNEIAKEVSIPPRRTCHIEQE